MPSTKSAMQRRSQIGRPIFRELARYNKRQPGADLWPAVTDAMRYHVAMRAGPVKLALLIAGLMLAACVRTEPRIAAPPAGFITDEGEAAYHAFVAELAYQREDFVTAAQEYLAAAQVSSDREIARRAVTVAMRSAQHEIAWQASSLWLARDPDNPDAHRTRAQLAVRSERTDESLPHLEFLLTNGPRDREAAWLTLLFLLGPEENEQGALAALQALSAAHPDEAEGHFVVAALALEADKPVIARTAAERAARLAPDWARAGMMRARTLLATGETAAGIEAARAVVAQHEDLEVSLEFAGLLADEQRYDEARVVLAEVLKARPDMPDALYAAGLLEIRDQQPEQARVYFTNLLGTGERRLDALYFLATIAEQLDETADALQLYLRIRSGRHFHSAQLQVGRLLYELEQREAAFEHLDRFAQRFPEHAESALLVQGGLLTSDDDYPGAVALYSEALESDPDARSLRYARALAYERLDRVDEALADLYLLVETEPTDSSALNALGYTLADRTGRLQEALGYIERALEMQPDNGPVLDSMGWVHYRLGNYDQALHFLQLAWVASPDPEIGAHLGEVLWVQGETERARAVWLQAIESGPGNRTLLKTLDRLLGGEPLKPVESQDLTVDESVS